VVAAALEELSAEIIERLFRVSLHRRECREAVLRPGGEHDPATRLRGSVEQVQEPTTEKVLLARFGVHQQGCATPASRSTAAFTWSTTPGRSGAATTTPGKLRTKSMNVVLLPPPDTAT
jgi:hypothetical protein